MKKHEVSIEPDVRAVLERCTFGHGTVALPDQLERKLYERVNKVIVAAGGKWDRRARSHVFVGGRDPRVIFGLALETGAVVDTKKSLQQFFSSPEVAAIVCQRVRIGDRVLEPSAGAGQLAIQARAQGGHVTCVEIDPELAAGLVKMGFTTVQQDFLTVRADIQTHWYERIVMNPPFEGGRDIEHVQHAFKFLIPGGILRSVMGGGVQTNSSKAAVQFRALTQAFGSMESLPLASFAHAGTLVNTVLVEWMKP